MECPKRRSRWGRFKDRLKNTSVTVVDTTQTLVAPLQELSDAFPPLSGTAYGVVALWKISQRAKRSKSDAQELAHRAHDVLYQVCSSIDMENPSDLPAHLREEIQRFEQLVQEISRTLEPIISNKPAQLFKALNRNQYQIAFYKRRLDDVCQGFMMGSATRQETRLAELKREITGIRVNLQQNPCFTTIDQHNRELQVGLGPRQMHLWKYSLMIGILFF